MKKFSLLFLALSLAPAPHAQAATTKPTPKPTVKVATTVIPKKASPATTAQGSTKSTKRASAQPSVKSSAKTTAKTGATKKATAPSTKNSPSKSAPVKSAKKPVKKPVKKVVKKVRVTPSPKPKWPPSGFYGDKASDNDVYARIPSSKELIGVISAKASLSQRIAECEKFACGAVQVASFIGCSWWEVTSTLYETQPDKSRKSIGNLRTLVGKSAPQQILTILLISQESVAAGQIIDNISVSCHRDTPTEDFPQYSYTPIATASEGSLKS